MASMGIYIFKWDLLRSYLKKDAEDKTSDHDFGKNVLPLMLSEGRQMFAWNFDGYWKDVGTVRSYWQSNMDLLCEKNDLNIYDKSWRIYTRNRNLPPQYIGDEGIVNNSLINEGCRIEGEVNNSIIFSGVTIEKGARVNNSIVLTDATVKSGSVLEKVIVLEDLTVEENTIIGKENEDIIYTFSNEGIDKE